MTKLDNILKNRDITLPTKSLSSQSYGFPSSHIWMWELDHKDGWALKNWCFWIMVLGKTLESPLDCKEIKPVNSKRNPPWIFTGRTDTKTEAPILWPPDGNRRLIGIDPDAGENWGQEDKVVTEDEMVGWHHWLSGHEFEHTCGDSDGQRSLTRQVKCLNLWGHKELDTTEQLNCTALVPAFGYFNSLCWQRSVFSKL